MKKKRILVTGASGFIGMHIARYLTKHDYDVVGVARTLRSFPADFKFISHDLAEPLDIEGTFDAIVHAAALKNGSGGTFKDLWRNNVSATVNVLDFAVARKIRHLVFLSSSEVFGEGAHGTVDEDSPILNPNPYGISKYAAELLLKEQSEVRTISLRLPGVIGSGASGVWLANMVDKFAAHESVTIYSPEFETANFVHLDDLAGFLEVIFEGDESIPRTLVLACKKKERIADIGEYCKKTLGSCSSIYIGEARKPSYCLDASRAFAVGYRSKSPFEIIDIFLRDFASLRKDQDVCTIGTDLYLEERTG